MLYRICRCDQKCISQNHKEKTNKKAGCKSTALIGSSEIVKGAQAFER